MTEFDFFCVNYNFNLKSDEMGHIAFPDECYNKTKLTTI